MARHFQEALPEPAPGAQLSLATTTGRVLCGRVQTFPQGELGQAMAVMSEDGGATWNMIDTVDGRDQRILTSWVQPG